VSSCRNATGAAAAGRRDAGGLLRPTETAPLAGLRRDHPVAAELQPFVERYWSVRWDLTGREPYRSEVLPAPAVNLSVEEGDPHRFGFALPAALVHAVVLRRFTVDLAGTGRVTAAKFWPGGYAALAGHSPAPGTITRLDGGLGVDPRVLVESVLGPERDDERAAALDACLAPRAVEPPRAYLDLQEVLTRMRTDRALVRVDDVAREGVVGVRALQRLFAAYVGVGPKAVLARYRLQDAVAEIDAGRVDDQAGLAATLGWSDQAHFSREFRAAVGSTPSAYLQRARACVASDRTTG
jgi:AraC-like DNA-binding protein